MQVQDQPGRHPEDDCQRGHGGDCATAGPSRRGAGRSAVAVPLGQLGWYRASVCRPPSPRIAAGGGGAALWRRRRAADGHPAGRRGRPRARRRRPVAPARRPRGGDLREATDVADDGRRAEGQCRGQHAGEIQSLGTAVGEDDEVGATKARGELGLGDEPADPAHARRRGGSERSIGIRGCPTIHSSGIRRCDPATPEKHVHPLVGAQQPEEQHDRPGPPVATELAGQRRRARTPASGTRTPRGGSRAPSLPDPRARPGWPRRTRSGPPRRPPAHTAGAGHSTWPGRGSRGSRSCAVSTSGRAGSRSGPASPPAAIGSARRRPERAAAR